MNREPEIFNLALTTKDTEYSQVIPDGIVKLQISSRLMGTLKIAYVEGETATKYITIPAGSSGKYMAEFELNGKTLYIQSDTDNDVAEIEVWK